jgi:hypothetical protein
LFEEVNQTLDLFCERVVVGRADQAQLAVERSYRWRVSLMPVRVLLENGGGAGAREVDRGHGGAARVGFVAADPRAGLAQEIDRRLGGDDARIGFFDGDGRGSTPW